MCNYDPDVIRSILKGPESTGESLLLYDPPAWPLGKEAMDKSNHAWIESPFANLILKWNQSKPTQESPLPNCSTDNIGLEFSAKNAEKSQLICLKVVCDFSTRCHLRPKSSKTAC